MRSQASKPLPKKGDLSKISFKNSSKQPVKKAVSPKKVKNLVNKSLIKNPKNVSSQEVSSNSKNGDDSGTSDKHETSSESSKSAPSKASTSRGDSPTKKVKKDLKEKKDTPKNAPESVKKALPRKVTKAIRKPKPVKANVKKCGKGKKDVKYKINKDVIKKNTPKYSKAKTVIKKGNAANNDKKKGATQTKSETTDKDKNTDDIENSTDDSVNNKSNTPSESNDESGKKERSEDKSNDKVDSKNITDSVVYKTPPKSSSGNQPETPKAEIERPPKFFTSTRSPRTVDIDVKCCKNSKGNLSVSERFLSMKVENKVEDCAKDKSSSNSSLVSQGPDIDVYTFTEKVDSPKSILSDFRSPVNKNVGRVRPIARVKGTVIDKKTDSEKKKYSPHRPIEEVVKQLKNKRSEELNANQNQSVNTATSVEMNPVNNETEAEEKPKPIVSKSYKMVARKSSITGKPFSPIKFLEQETAANKNEKPEKAVKPNPNTKKIPAKTKKQGKVTSLSDEDIDNSKFALNTKTFHYSSSEESDSNDDNDTKESSESDNPKNKRSKNKRFNKNRIMDGAKKPPSKELKELSKDSLIDLKDSSHLLGNEKPSKRRLKLLSMWSGPKKHRMASLNAIAKVHCLYENESKTHMELGLMKTIDRPVLPSTSKTVIPKKKENKPKETEKQESTSESEYEVKKEKKEDSSESSDDNPPQRPLRGLGIRSAGKYWDPKSSTSSSEDSEQDTKKKVTTTEKKKASPKASTSKSDSDKPPAKMKKTAGVPVKKKRNRNEVVMDLKDMVVQKRMASLNATAILAASYEKRSPKSNKDETTSDSCSDESYSQKSKNGVSSGVKSESKNEYEAPSESDESAVSDRKQKVEVIVNQDTDVTITGVYATHHHEGFCTVSGMQYRISSTSHTQTTATANCEKVRILISCQ